MKAAKTALVAEGGGMRGIFTAGVLDAFLKESFNPFDLLIGVSAGAVSLASYLSGQHGRYYRLSTGAMKDPRFVSLGRFIRGGHLLDLDWLWNYASIHDPLDVAAATSHPGHEFLIGITDVMTAEPMYVKPDAGTLLPSLLASSALPVLYRNFVDLSGRKVADGGVADPLPVKEAYRRGARRIVVIRTRPAGWSKGWLADSLMSLFFLRRYPALCSRIRKHRSEYISAVQFIRNPPGDAEVMEVMPPPGLRSARLYVDRAALNSDYKMGLEAGQLFMGNFEGAGSGRLLQSNSRGKTRNKKP